MKIKRLREEFEKHSFLKNVMVLVSGNVLGYAINFCSLPLISRIYTPGEIGEYDLIISSGRFVIDIISMGLLIAIMLPKEDRKARQICQLIRFSNLCFLSVLFGLAYIIRGKYPLFETSIPYIWALLLLMVYLFTYNMQSLYYSYTNRCKEYHILFWNPLLLAISNTGISIILGILGLGTTGYLMGTIVSYLICIVHMQKKIKPFHEKANIKDWFDRLKEYKEIPLVQLPANVISQIGNEIPTQYLGRLFGSDMLGGYSMSVKIMSVPVSLLATPINRVVYQTMAEKRNKRENVGDFLFELLEKYIKIAILPVGLLIVLGEKIIPFLLGNAWRAAGQYIVILGAVYLLKFCSACVSGTFVIMGRQKLSLVMSLANLVKYGVCFGCSYYWRLDVYSTIAMYAATEFLFQLLNLILCVYCTDYSVFKFLLFVFKYIVIGNLLIYFLYFVFTKYVF